MNKPFEVCLRLVLPRPTAAGPDGYRDQPPTGSSQKGKGQLQTGIEDLLYRADVRLRWTLANS